jgi:hypothetical protein
LALAATGLPRRARAGLRLEGKRPRYYVQICMHGGIDAVLTTAPKVRGDVDPDIDVPYGPEKIVDTGAVQLGPTFAPLAALDVPFAVLNGVQVRTVSHNSGSEQTMRMRTSVTRRMPALLDLIGSVRADQPLGWYALGAARQEYAPNWFGDTKLSKKKSLWEAIDAASPDDLGLMAKLLSENAQTLTSVGGDRALRTGANVEQCAALFRRLREVPPFHSEQWSTDPVAQVYAQQFQRILWTLQHDLTCGVFLSPAILAWDSHYDNLLKQTRETSSFIPMFVRFVGELERRSNLAGSLMSNTLLVLGSELGRFPRLNAEHGKDHFPEAPLLFLGAGVRSARKKGITFGHLGRQMQSLPISLKTGSTGSHPLVLDDVGTTLLHIAGLDPELYGYGGKLLEFLL